jgi:redox-sensitive bicupin YhaK (pirin superfamily)
MTITYRDPSTLGHLKEDWIETYRTFSNNSYYDPNYIHFSDLEVINDDRVQPQNLVPIHQHCDMEILGYIIDGPCYHNDNLHNYGEVPSGCVQRMSSGTGIWHTEGNLSDHPIRYLQIWLRPNKHNFAANYDVMYFDRSDKLNRFCPIASDSGPIVIQSDAKLYAGIFTEDFNQELDANRKYYVYVVSGTVTINGIDTVESGGFTFEQENLLKISNANNTELLLFNLRH